MRSTTAIGFLSLLIPFVSGFHVSGNEVEGGLYKVSIDARGQQVHELLTPDLVSRDAGLAKASNALVLADREIPARFKSAAKELFAREPRLYCGCGIVLDRSDCDAAVDNMKVQIRNHGGRVFVPIGQAYYAVRGGVVSFICTRRGNNAITGVSEGDFTNLLGVVTQNCGLYVAGTYRHGDSNASEDVGYMNAGGDFCGAAEASNKERC
ncbi:hypothetical protein B0H63DRAFT_508500 [Podospora didyma]|uniref:Ecp2 effector protein domain-containing protein n=1 Tax=Podospora didyma TaxID=330526 RepID=A0AAE0NRP8_9PEZI|nr:hypothetical protein B0H63DRAFT_508500 [Podospora didyma]